ALLTLLRDPEGVRRLGEAGRALAAGYRREKVVPDLVALLERVATSTNSASHGAAIWSEAKSTGASGGAGAGGAASRRSIAAVIATGSWGDAKPTSWPSRSSRRAVSLPRPA